MCHCSGKSSAVFLMESALTSHGSSKLNKKPSDGRGILDYASPINDFEGFLHIFYCRIKNFTESLTEKLLRQVGWQGRVQNNRNSPHDVRSPDCRVLTQTYSPNLFSSRFWRVGEQWFLSLCLGDDWEPIYQFIPATYLCLSQARIWISIVICCGLFVVFWELRWEIRFVDIGGIVDHHCLNFLFINHKCSWCHISDY
jgi:hypothetical protein